jgi:chromosome partitioning protein
VPKKPKPVEPYAAIKTLPKLGRKSSLTPPGTTIIAFANFKGGVGKTTSAVNVAGCLAHNFNKKVLLIDLDVQSSLGQWLMGAEWWHNWSKHLKKTSYQIFLDIINGAHAWGIEESTFKHPACQRLYVCPATFDMLSLDTQLHHALSKPIHPKAFQCLDIQIKKICSQFDYIIFDCPPNMYMTTQNALFCADHIIIPTLPDFLSTAGLKRLVGFLKDLREQFLLFDTDPAKIAGVVINMFNKNKKLMQSTIEEIEGYMEAEKHSNAIFSKKAKVFRPYICNLNDVAKAQEEQKPVNIAFPVCDASKDFIQLTDQIMRSL